MTFHINIYTCLQNLDLHVILNAIQKQLSQVFNVPLSSYIR